MSKMTEFKNENPKLIKELKTELGSKYSTFVERVESLYHELSEKAIHIVLSDDMVYIVQTNGGTRLAQSMCVKARNDLDLPQNNNSRIVTVKDRVCMCDNFISSEAFLAMYEDTRVVFVNVNLPLDQHGRPLNYNINNLQAKYHFQPGTSDWYYSKGLRGDTFITNGNFNIERVEVVK